MKDVIEHLERIGFSTREAAVYVSLISGARKIHEISAASGVSRASTYRALEDLLERGLVHEEEHDGERVIFPESPETVVRILQRERVQIDEKISIAEDAVAKLKPFYESDEAVPHVRYVKGARALRLLQKEFAERGQDILQISGYDAFRALYTEDFSREHEEEYKPTQARIRSILVTDKELTFTPGLQIEIIKLSPSLFPIQGELSVSGNYTILFSYTDDIIAICIHSPVIAKTVREALELSWKAAKELQKTP